MNFPDAQPSTPVVFEPERRHHPRYSTQVPIEIRIDGSDVPLRLETTDLSRGGCYVQLMIPLSVSVRLLATLWLDGCPVVVRGMVITRHPQFGNGIAFMEFEGEGAQTLQHYLAEITT